MLKVFIGFLFVFINIDISGFDLAANFIGHILIYLGLREYPDIVPFKNARIFTIVMLIHSLANTIYPIFVTDVSKALVIITAVISVIVSLLGIFQLYFIIRGIGGLEEKTELNLNYDKFDSLWKKLFAAELLCSCFMGATSIISVVQAERLVEGFSSDSFTPVIAIISIISAATAIAVLVIDIYFLIYFYKAKTALDSYKPEEHPDDYQQ